MEKPKHTFWATQYYFSHLLSLFSFTSGIPVTQISFVVVPHILEDPFIYFIFCFISVVKIGSFLLSSSLLILPSVPTILLKLLLSRLPTTSYCQIQSYFSVFIWFYLSISFNIMSYSLILEILSFLSLLPWYHTVLAFFPIALYDLSQTILPAQLLRCNLTSKC